MKGVIMTAAIIGLTACSQRPQSPTVAELEGNLTLLKQWHEKCSTGEFSNLPLDQWFAQCNSQSVAGQYLANKSIEEQNKRLFAGRFSKP